MEFRARFSQTAGLSALLLGPAAICALIAWAQGAGSIFAGVFWSAALALAFGGAVLAWRAISRPVMVRVDETGVYMKRLDATFPWDAIARVERTTHQGGRLISLVPADPANPVWSQRSVTLSRALSAKAGLPELIVDLGGMAPGQDAFLTAVSSIGRAPVVDQT